MTQAARSVAQGRYRERVEVTTRDEIGQLARAFNTMAEQLDLRIQAMLQDRNKVLTILSGMVEGVVAADRVGKVIHMNEAALKMLGGGDVSPEGRHLWEVNAALPVREVFAETLRDGEERRREVQIGVAPPRTIALHSSLLRDGEGQPSGVVILLHDVTRMRRLEGLRRDFVANVSHELKTPLTAIRGLVETIADSGAEMPEETRARFLEKVQRQVNRLAALVTDLLTLARIESEDDRPYEPRRLDLRDGIGDCFRRALPAAEEKKLSLRLEQPEQPVCISAEDEAVRSIVDNLLQNAIRYTESGGSISLSLSADANRVVIVVEDTGIGIAVEHRERIFERFYRVDKARSREAGGTGLGLSIVKHLVAGLDGSIELQSEPGKGSVFRVMLPAMDA